MTVAGAGYARLSRRNSQGDREEEMSRTELAGQKRGNYQSGRRKGTPVAETTWFQKCHECLEKKKQNWQTRGRERECISEALKGETALGGRG